MAGKQHISLTTIGEASQFLAKIINQVYRDEMDKNKASKLGYLVNLFISSVKESDLEKRVQALEESKENAEVY